jgi:hypothetical protein
MALTHRLNMEVALQSLFGLLCTAVLTPQLPPSPRIWAHIRGRYWSAKMDTTSLCNPPGLTCCCCSCEYLAKAPQHNIGAQREEEKTILNKELTKKKYQKRVLILYRTVSREYFHCSLLFKNNNNKN